MTHELGTSAINHGLKNRFVQLNNPKSTKSHYNLTQHVKPAMELGNRKKNKLILVFRVFFYTFIQNKITKSSLKQKIIATCWAENKRTTK